MMAMLKFYLWHIILIFASILGLFLGNSFTKPIIGVPIDSSPIQGMDSLLSIVQMPPGIPVATVAVNGAKNAGILAFGCSSLFLSILKPNISNAIIILLKWATSNHKSMYK